MTIETNHIAINGFRSRSQKSVRNPIIGVTITPAKIRAAAVKNARHSVRYRNFILE